MNAPVLALACAAVILDGLDNQLLGLAMPLLIRDWGASRSDFVPVVTLGLIGMGVGSAAAGALADRFGRRPLLIACVLLFALATGAIALVQGLPALTLLRVFASLGLGGTLTIATTLLAEWAPGNRRSLMVAGAMLCVPVGGLVGGLVASVVLPAVGWRALFALGGGVTLLVALLLLLLLPESPGFAAERSDPLAGAAPAVDPAGLLAAGARRDSLALWLAFFCSLFANYLVFNWAPTMLSGLGYGLATASRGLAAFNLGGIIGGLVAAWSLDRYGSRRTLLGLAVAGVVLALASLVTLHLLRPADGVIIVLFCLQGLFASGFQVGLFPLAVHVYPAAIRGRGVGAALAVGRFGAVIGAGAGAWILGLGDGGMFAAVTLMLLGAALAVAGVRRQILPEATP